MSTLVVSNISDGTTTVGASYVTNGSAKAWVNFDGTGTVAIRSSFNTSSITDNGVGNYTQNYSSSMLNDDYSVATTSTSSNGSGEFCKPNRYNMYEPIGPSYLVVVTWDSASAWFDPQFVLLQSFGDLA